MGFCLFKHDCLAFYVIVEISKWAKQLCNTEDNAIFVYKLRKLMLVRVTWANYGVIYVAF